jgi:hypothetical protein
MTQDNVDAYRNVCSGDKSVDDVGRLAESLIVEAENSKQLLSALHEVTSRGAEDIDAKLKQISQDLSQFIAARLVGGAGASTFGLMTHLIQR